VSHWLTPPLYVLRHEELSHLDAGRRCLTRQCNGLCGCISDGIYRHARRALGLTETRLKNRSTKADRAVLYVKMEILQYSEKCFE